MRRKKEWSNICTVICVAVAAFFAAVFFLWGIMWVFAEDAHSKQVTWRTAHASWYGPGLYGNRTACGQRLSPYIQGVAHKYLPCGTKVRFMYRGRKLTVRVIDRGPFVAGREFDLTNATRLYFRFPDLGYIKWRKVR